MIKFERRDGKKSIVITDDLLGSLPQSPLPESIGSKTSYKSQRWLKSDSPRVNPPNPTTLRIGNGMRQNTPSGSMTKAALVTPIRHQVDNRKPPPNQPTRLDSSGQKRKPSGPSSRPTLNSEQETMNVAVPITTKQNGSSYIQPLSRIPHPKGDSSLPLHPKAGDTAPQDRCDVAVSEKPTSAALSGSSQQQLLQKKAESEQSLAMADRQTKTISKFTLTPGHKDEPSAMKSSFSASAPGLVMYDLEQEKKEKQRKWRADLDMQIKEKNSQQTERGTLSSNRVSNTQVFPKTVDRPGEQLSAASHLMSNNSRASIPVAIRSSFTIDAPGLVHYDVEAEKKEKHRLWLRDLEQQINEKKARQITESPLRTGSRSGSLISESASKAEDSGHADHYQMTGGPSPNKNRMDLPAAMKSSFAINAPGLVQYDVEAEKKEKHRLWLRDLEQQIKDQKATQHSGGFTTDDRPTINNISSPRALSTMDNSSSGLPSVSDSPMSDRARTALPAAMKSSFAISAPGTVHYDVEADKKVKQKQWLSDLYKQIEEKNASQKMAKSSEEKTDMDPNISLSEDWKPPAHPVQSRITSGTVSDKNERKNQSVVADIERQVKEKTEQLIKEKNRTFQNKCQTNEISRVNNQQRLDSNLALSSVKQSQGKGSSRALVSWRRPIVASEGAGDEPSIINNHLKDPEPSVSIIASPITNPDSPRPVESNIDGEPIHPSLSLVPSSQPRTDTSSSTTVKRSANISYRLKDPRSSLKNVEIVNTGNLSQSHPYSDVEKELSRLPSTQFQNGYSLESARELPVVDPDKSDVQSSQADMVHTRKQAMSRSTPFNVGGSTDPSLCSPIFPGHPVTHYMPAVSLESPSKDCFTDLGSPRLCETPMSPSESSVWSRSQGNSSRISHVFDGIELSKVKLSGRLTSSRPASLAPPSLDVREIPAQQTRSQSTQFLRVSPYQREALLQLQLLKRELTERRNAIEYELLLGTEI